MVACRMKRYHRPNFRFMERFLTMLSSLLLPTMFIAGCSVGPAGTASTGVSQPIPSPTWSADPQLYAQMKVTVQAWLTNDTKNSVVQFIDSAPYHEDLGKIPQIGHSVVVSPIYQEQSSQGDLRIVCLTLSPHGTHVALVISGGDIARLAKLNGLGLQIIDARFTSGPLINATSGGMAVDAKTVPDAVEALLNLESNNRRIAVVSVVDHYVDPSTLPEVISGPDLAGLVALNNTRYKPGADLMAWLLGKSQTQPVAVATSSQQVQTLLTTSDQSILPVTTVVQYAQG